MKKDLQLLVLELNERLKRQEATVEQLISIIASTNQKCNELTYQHQAVIEFLLNDSKYAPIKDPRKTPRKAASFR